MNDQLLTASITKLKRNPVRTLKEGNGSSVAILKRNKLAFYCVPPDLFAYYVELAEDAALNQVADERMASLDVVSVSLDDL
ncbi:plasmid stabilization protein [Aeromonas hydrophila]|uniref:plasmid stabilization protein n=1 Tax=Aeromonas hydrophila TaxID=644 RepID=UPI00216A38F1|nr:plasmid stabilization protein [Aeromonas hydrophila]